MSDRVLTQPDVDHFLAHGYVRVRDCFSRELAEEWTGQACRRLHASLGDPKTWPQGPVRPPQSQRVAFEQIAPRAWQAACELVGGAQRIQKPCDWGDSFIINFGLQPEFHWEPPSAEVRDWHKWHKDGDFFRHFLDSPEQGLLVVALFSDLQSRGGGTFVACDSVALVARYLAEHPEGLLPGELPANEIISRCREFIEVTGTVGDVLLLHPFVLHSKSVNALPTPRFLINPPVKLVEPLCFSRSAGDPYSLVELAILRALGTDRFEFVPAAPRQAVVPARLALEKKLWEERSRAAQSDR